MIGHGSIYHEIAEHVPGLQFGMPLHEAADLILKELLRLNLEIDRLKAGAK